jgi:hypothetical protein
LAAWGGFFRATSLFVAAGLSVFIHLGRFFHFGTRFALFLTVFAPFLLDPT